MGKRVVKVSKEELKRLSELYGARSRRISDELRKRSIKGGDGRYSTAPREIFMSVRVSPIERELIRKRYGSLAGLRDYGLKIIQEESGGDIDTDIK
jgi:hypothetical protein